LPCTLYAVESVETWADPGSSSACRSASRGCPELFDKSTLEALAASLPAVTSDEASSSITDDRSNAWKLVAMDLAQIPHTHTIESVQTGFEPDWESVWPAGGGAAELAAAKDAHVRVLRAKFEWKLWLNPNGIA
jgi:hypothetical protein